MEIISSATTSFDAAHRIPGYEPCSYGDGHTWTVTAQCAGELDPKTGWVRGAQDLPIALEQLCAEYHRTNLDVLMPAVVSTPLGIAGHILERLASHFPHLTAVRVECSDETAGEIRRTPRQL